MGTAGGISLRRLRPAHFALLAAPLLWIVVAFLHPGEEPYAGIADEADKWIFVHMAQLVLTPFLAAGVWLLLEGLESVAAKIARAFLVLWMVFFSAFDAVAGIAVGILARHANGLTGQEQAGAIAEVDYLWNNKLAGGEFSVLGNVAHGAWVVVAIAATVALYQARTSRVIVGATLVSVLFATHSGVGAAVGLVALFVAELLAFGTRRGERVSRATPQPA